MPSEKEEYVTPALVTIQIISDRAILQYPVSGEKVPYEEYPGY